MKRILSILAILALFLLNVFLSTPASALPTLQLDIVPGVYDTTTETTVATGPSFTVRTLLDGPTDADNTYYLAVAVLPRIDPKPATNPDIGSFSIDLIDGAFLFGSPSMPYSGWHTINVTADMAWGIPPVDTEAKDLAGHGIFPTYYAEFAFSFDTAKTIGAYNTDPREAQPDSGFLSYQEFAIDVAGLDPAYIIHFDLYHTAVKNNKLYIDEFAPFSHDAESSTTPVPEPATMLLLGTGLIGLAGLKRRFGKS